ncbi:hypothetical protein V5O48_005851 [Marasmius crinis-equi]|uniref:Amidase domain-containing protein n=1 Tax=Marasmius crinis-equi TaxID=585013 RepID=A0ABR3FL77_9AGAR
MSERAEDYQSICKHVHRRRTRQIQLLPGSTFRPITPAEEEILSYSISDIVAKCSRGEITRGAIRQSYMKKVVGAQKEFNCVSEVVILDEELQKPEEEVNGTKRPLEGVPVTVKDTIDVGDHHTTIGFARNAHNRVELHSPLVRLLLDAGCIILAKSTVPTALFSISTSSPLFSGPTLNPHNSSYGVGASTGGGGALVASKATLAEMGSDVAGSIRLPAHFTGVYGLKGSAGRWPSEGNRSSMEGVECLKTLGGPLTQRMEDMIDIWRGVVKMKPWEYESSCLSIPWRESELQDVMEGRLKFGVVWSDGLVPPSPACRRALTMAIDALRDEGHEVIDVTPHTPSIPGLLTIGYQLAFGDGCSQIVSQLHSDGEPLNLPLQAIVDLVQLPSWKRSLLCLLIQGLSLFGVGVPTFEGCRMSNTSESTSAHWTTRVLDSLFPRRHIGHAFYKDQLGLLSIVKPQSIFSERALIEARNGLRREWHEKVWKEHGVDFLLTPAAPLPAFREEVGEKKWPLGEDSLSESKEEESSGGWFTKLFGWWGRRKTKQVVGKGDPERAGLGAAGYTFLFNLLDYTAGVLPITTVDREVDALLPPHPEAPVHKVQPKGQIYEKTLPQSIYMRYSDGRIPLPDEGYPLPEREPASPTSTASTLVDSTADRLFDKLKSSPPSLPYYAANAASYTAYSVYDPIGMHGLPVGIQVVGRQLEEERVLGAMKVVDDAIKKAGWSID